MFQVGQKVVCIDAADYIPSTNMVGSVLERGRIYTVCKVGLTNSLDPKRLPCIQVLEIDDWPLWAHRFRSAVERKTDISIFKKMLAPNRQRA